MSRFFAAEYNGVCNDCEDKIKRGDLIGYNDNNKVAHRHCIIPTSNTAQLCNKCFTVHVGECL